MNSFRTYFNPFVPGVPILGRFLKKIPNTTGFITAFQNFIKYTLSICSQYLVIDSSTFSEKKAQYMFDCNTNMDFLGKKKLIRKGKIFHLFIYQLINECYFLLEETLF